MIPSGDATEKQREKAVNRLVLKRRAETWKAQCSDSTACVGLRGRVLSIRASVGSLERPYARKWLHIRSR